MSWGEVFQIVKFVHGKGKNRKKIEPEADGAGKGEFWSITGVNWSWRTEEHGCQVGRVKSFMSCIETTSVWCWFVDSLPISNLS
jgi:hypothetical protein